MRTRSDQRQFLSTALSASAAWALHGSRPLAADKPRKIKSIDIHTHLGAFHFGQELTAELLMRFMDQHDVEKACVLPLIGHAADFWTSISGDATFEDFGREFLIRNADQLLFGTDVLMPEQKIPQFELLDSLKLPEDVQ